MRVTHIIKATGIAGAERHLLTLLAGLRTCGIDTEMILLVERDKPLDEYVALLEAQGIPVQRLVIHHDLDLSLYWRIRKFLRESQPDMVHTHLWHADLFGIPAARLAGVAHVITSRHNDDAFRRKAVIRSVNHLLWWMTDTGIAISESIRRFCIEIENARPDKVQTVRYGMEHDPNALDRPAAYKALRSELNLDADALLVGMVCRLTEQKGVVYGVRAFAQIADDFPQAHLIIAGDGLLKADLQREVEQLNLAEHAHFLGWREDVPKLMAALDVFLMPSLWEGFGLVMLEAMAQQIPIIGSDVSALPEVIVEAETGYLVPPRDPDAIAEKLRLLLADRPLRRYLGQNGEARLETAFSAGRMVEETIAVYQAVSEKL